MLASLRFIAFCSALCLPNVLLGPMVSIASDKKLAITQEQEKEPKSERHKAGKSASEGRQVRLRAALAHPTMVLDDRKRSENHLRVALNGLDLPKSDQRAEVNLAIVIDRSGSMQGDKINNARRAAMAAIDRLSDEDIISVVVYDTSVEVIVPATKATDRESIKQRIQQLQANGNTALYEGVKKGASEVRKFHSDRRVNRVILLSDGLANVGPTTPHELAELGRSLSDEGTSISTMGLGLSYNEDLMSQLAVAGGGTHTFIESADALAEVFQREFDDVMSVVAQDFKIEIKLAKSVRPVKVLNYPAEIDGQNVSIELCQIYARQERYFVLELEIEHGADGSSRPAADVAVTYQNAITHVKETLKASVEVKFSADKELAERSIDKEVVASCVIQSANERNTRATDLRDGGDIDGARRLLLENVDLFEMQSSRLGDESLRERAKLNASQADRLSDPDWNRQRKAMRESQLGDALQPSYSGKGTQR